MNSVATETIAGKLSTTKVASTCVLDATDGPAVDSGGNRSTTTTVVIIKAEPCEDTSVHNGGALVQSIEVTENGSGDLGLEVGSGSMQAKTTINGTTNQNRMIRTTSAKSKHLTRSHAMRESASPPRSPGMRDCNGLSVVCDNNKDDQVARGTSEPGSGCGATMAEVLSPPKLHSTESGQTASQLDLDFPKLNAPKPKSPRNMDKSQSSDSSKSVNSLDAHSPTATLNRKSECLGRNLSPSSQHSNKELAALEHDSSPLLSPGSYDNRSSGREHSKSPSSENRGSGQHGKKHKGASGAKSTNKLRLKAQGSSSSVEGNNNSTVFISKDNSFEQFTDQSGVDLIKFFRETLNKNAKDRSMLLKIEKELHDLATDRNRLQVKFPSMSSYNRMLIHRCAAYFGMDHNVDASQTSVIVAVTKSTRIPEILFDTLIRESLDEPRKSILKRDSHSFDECRHSLLPNPDRGLLDRKAKSFEEREDDYEKARRRIFRGRELVAGGFRGVEMQDENSWPWSSTESSDNSSKMKAQSNRLLKVQSLSVDTRHDRPSVSKSHSFGGYVGPTSGGGGGGNHHGHHLNRGDSVTSTKSAGPRFFTKQDSMGGTPWRLSPSSSGYKTQTQSLQSDSITPSPTTGYGSGGEHTPEPQSSTGAGNRSVVWAVTDMASVPRGSVLIDPQTFQPIVNQDGSIYYFDPSNIPPMAMKMTHHGHMSRYYPPPFMGHNSSGSGGGGGHASGRRRTERNKGPAEENKEKGNNLSTSGSIDVIPEDQFQGSCTPTEEKTVDLTMPSEERSQNTKAETSSLDDQEDETVHHEMGIEEEAQEEGEDHGVPEIGTEDNENVDDEEVERIFVPDHKNQATSPSHPLTQSEDYAVVTGAMTSDPEPASSSQCLTSPPQSPLPQPPSQLLLRPIQTAITPTGDANGSPQTVEATATPSVVDLEESVATMTLEVEQNDCQESTVEAIPLPDAVPVDVEETEQISLAPKMTAESTPTTTVTPPATTISTNCTPSYSRTHNNAAGSASTNESKEESKSGVAVTNGRPVVQQPFNRNHSNNNSQGDPRSSSTTIVSPLNTTTSYQVHAVGQSQYVAHPSVRHDEQIHGYQPTGITYTTAIDPNGNAYAGTTNMPYTATYQQMPDTGGYMVYTAPYTMEAISEVPAYYVPVYDQAGNATLVPATGGRDAQQTTILQATPQPPTGTTIYQAGPNGTTLIPAMPTGSQLVYAPEGQFGTNMQQPQHYAAVPAGTYPPGTAVTYAPYGATAYNAPSTYHANFWGQPMTTYYVSSPPAQSMPQGVPIQIPVAMPQTMGTPQPQNTKGSSGAPHSNPPTPQATTFAGNPFAAGASGPPGGTMHMGSASGVMETMPPPVYAISATGVPVQMTGGPQAQNKYQNVYPYSAPVVPMQPTVSSAATPPAAIYQPVTSFQPPVVHSAPKPASVNNNNNSSHLQGVNAASTTELPTNPSSTTSTPLQKSPPTQMPETNPAVTGGYEKRIRRGPSSDGVSGGPTTQFSGPAQRNHGYIGNGYPTRNPNQTYTPRAYAPKKHYSMESPSNGLGHNKAIVLNPPMHQSSGSPGGIYGHYHHHGQPQVASASGPMQSHQSTVLQPTSIRGPRPKPANLDLRRTGSHYQPSNSSGGPPGGAQGTVGGGNSQRNTPSTNSTESNNSPNSVTGPSGGGGVANAAGGMGDPGRGGQMGYYHAPGGHPLVMHQPLMGSPANPGGHPGMYVKLGQTYFPHPTMATPMGGNRRSPPNEMRPQFNPHHSLTTGLYPMNMQLSGPPRHGGSGPRHGHHNSYKGSR